MPDYQNGAYSSDDYSFLESVSSNAKTTTIHKNAKTIKGISANNYAFSTCKDTIETVIFETGSLLSEISPYTFYQCSKLQQIDLTPCSHLTNIADHAFYQCKSLSSIKIPNSITKLREYSFYQTNLSTFTLPSSVTSISDYCFMYSSKLAQLEIPTDSNLVSLGKWVIIGTLVTSFYIPSKVNSISYAFSEGAQIQSITCSPSNPYYKVENAILIDKRSMITHTYPQRKGGSVIIPEGITGTMSAVFSSCGITSVQFPSSITYINEYSFQQNPLTEIEIPDSVTSMYKKAFYACDKLTTVKLPNKITTLPESCFEGCGLTSITIPDSVKIINDRCFLNCPNLREVILPDSISQLNGRVFDPTTQIRFSNNSKFYITADYVIMDKVNTTVVQYIGRNSDNSINIHFNVSEIKKSVFSDKTLLRSITFPVDSKLQTINDKAFINCYNLEFIGLPSSIVSIGSESFSNCYKLRSISLNYCNKIGSSAFLNCINLSIVTFEESSITNIPENCFYNCISLTTLNLPINLEIIGDKSFMLCTSLSNVVFHSSVSSFGESCFRQCNIKTVDLSVCSSFQTLSDNCF